MRKIYLLMLIGLFVLPALNAQLTLEVEGGIAFTSYNDVRIPNNDQSTRFSFNDDLKTDNLFAYRFNAHYRIRERHRITLFYAPFTVNPKGTFAEDVTFQGTVFPANEDIKGTYRFDSYRLQYRYYFKNDRRIMKGIGLTAKIRDAEISLAAENLFATKKNTGFVPIINFELSHSFYPGWDLLLEGDALFSPFGRAEDVLLAVKHKINERMSAAVGYRILEGGSDVDEVYTFALINYIVLNLQLRM